MRDDIRDIKHRFIAQYKNHPAMSGVALTTKDGVPAIKCNLTTLHFPGLLPAVFEGVQIVYEEIGNVVASAE